MKRILFGLLLWSTSSFGGLTFVTDPADGNVTGAPGSTVGWGFTFMVTPGDSNFYFLNRVEFCFGAQVTPCPLSQPGGVAGTGSFTDIAAALSGLVLDRIGVNSPVNANPYSEVFSGVLGSLAGLGSLYIDPLAAPQTLTGQLNVYYDIYDGNPFNACGGKVIMSLLAK